MDLAEFNRYIKQMVRKRRIIMIPMNALRLARLIVFQFTADHRRLKGLKNIHKGERCYIVGNGPSLTIEDLNRLEGQICFAFNRIYEVFPKTNWRPTYYMVLDNNAMANTAQHLDEINVKLRILNIMGKLRGIKPDERTVFFCSYGWYSPREFKFRKKYISKNISRRFSLNNSVTCDAIEAAIYMGFREIILLGIDHNYSKYIDRFGRGHCDSQVQDYHLTSNHDYVSFIHKDALESSYQCYKNYCDTHDIRIVNATRNGKLNIFTCQSLDELI